jgi:hypothetical protein
MTKLISRLKIIPVFAAMISIIHCDEVNKVERKLSGTIWEIVLVEGEGFYTGECGTPASTYDEWSAMDAGTYEFSDEAGIFGVDSDAKSGTLTLRYEYILNDRTISVDRSMSFDWYFLDDFLVIHNPDEFYFRDYAIDDFDKKSWVLGHSEGDGLGCSGYNSFHHIERQ